MECCSLCLELNNELMDTIETSSNRWREYGMTNVLEKHFWPIDSIIQPRSWICLSCWHEVDHFHKFYVRIEEAHNYFGRIKNDEKNQSLEQLSNIIIDHDELQAVLDDKDYPVKDEVNRETNDRDPLKKSTSARRKHIKSSSTFTTKPEDSLDVPEIKKEVTDSYSKDSENGTDDDDCNHEPDKNPIEYKNFKEGDKFIAEHFKQMFCDQCDVQFENFAAMKKHFLVTHSTRKGYLVCCNRKFYQRNPLVDHLKCHINPDHFKCIQCGKFLSDRKNLRNHMLRVHRPEDVVAKHTCETCGKSFGMAYVLRAHKLKHLPKEEKKFPCTQCGKFYASSHLLKIHTEVIHLKKQAKVCYICGITLGTSTEYKTHMNKHAGLPAPVINCDVCGLRLISERGLKLHKESQHPVGGKKDHPCHLCDKVSPTARALKKHINTMHEKGCDHKCTFCEKAFRRAEALKEHMASHTGTPLYACPWCPKTFNSNGNMHSHRKNTHPKEYLELKLQRYN